jgi:hypothetical protein
MKTPLIDRIDRYVTFYRPKRYIPIHPDEYNELMDSKAGAKEIEVLSEMYGLPILPLGYISDSMKPNYARW